MTGAQPTRTTERLVLRPFTPADAPDVRRLAGDRAIADTTLAIPHPYPEGAAEEWIATHAPGYANGTLASFAITLRGGGALAGAIGLIIVPDHARAELGYWVGVPYWRRGYATEAARSVLDFGFDALGLHRIQAHFLIRNPASGRVLEKIGMRPEGVRRHFVRKWGVFEDLGACAILAADRRSAAGSQSPATGGGEPEMKRIGIVRSPFARGEEVPRGLGAKHETEGTLEIRPELEAGLADLEGFSHLYVVWVFDRSEGYDLSVTPPSDDRPHGVFATRSPRRPNPIGLTVVRLIGRDGPRLRVRGVDMLDGTPILDIKPYLSSVPEAELRRGWLADAEARDAGRAPGS